MASILRPKLEIGLGLNKLGLDKGLKGAKSGLQGLDKSVKHSTGLLGKLGRAFTGIFSKGLGVAAGLGIFRLVQKIGGAFEDLGNQALDFNEQMANVFSIAHMNDAEKTGFTDEVLKLAEDKRITDMPKTLAAGLYDIVSAGFEAADALTVLEAAAIAATAGRTTTETSAGVISGVLNAYNLDASHATEVSNQLFKIVDKGVITFEQLANVIGYVLPTAEALGVSVDEVGAAFISMTRQGIESSAAAANLSGILNGLLKPTGEMSELIASLGYESGAAMLDALGLSGAIQAVIDATGGDASKAAELFGDIRALRGILALTNDDGALYTEGLGDMSHAQDGAGATAIALKEQMQSVRFQLRLLHKNIVLFFTEGLGQKSMKKIAAFIALFNRFFDRLFKLRHEFNGMKAFMLSFHTLLNQMFGSKVGGALFEAFRELIRIIHIFKLIAEGDWDRAWRHIKRVGRDAERFLSWLWGTIKDIFNSIDWQAVGDTLWTGMQLAWNFVADKTVNWLWPKLKKTVVDAWDAIPWADIGNTIWSGTKRYWNFVTKKELPWLNKKFKELLTKAWDRVNWKAVGSAIRTGLKEAFDFALDNPTAIVGAGAGLAGLIAFGPVGGLIAAAIALGIMANRDAIGKALEDAISKGANKIQVSIGGINWSGIGESMVTLMTILGDWISKNPQMIGKAIATVFLAIPYLISETLSEVGIEIILGILNEVAKHPKEAAEALVILFIAAIGLALFITYLPELIVIALIAGILTAMWKKKEDISFTGRFLLYRIYVGMNNFLGWFLSQIGIVFIFQIVQTFMGGYNDFWLAGKYLITGFWDGIKWMWDNSIAGNLAALIEGGIKVVNDRLGNKSPSKVFKEIGKNTMQGFIIGIMSKSGEIEKVMANAVAIPSRTDFTMPGMPAASRETAMQFGNSLKSKITHIAEGAIVVQDSSNPEATAAAILKRIRFIEAGAPT